MNGNRAIVLGVVLALFVAVTVFAFLAGRLTPPSSAPPSRPAGGDRPSVSPLPSPSLPSPSLPSESPSSPTGSPSPDGGESPTPTRPPVTRIAAVGDIHVGPDSVGRVAAGLAHVGERADVLLLAGDLTRCGSVAEAELVAAEVAGATIPVVAVLGNHDYESDEQD